MPFVFGHVIIIWDSRGFAPLPGPDCIHDDEDTMTQKPAVFIFSYNRGGHLELCVRSALTHAGGCRIVVIDDASTDPATIRVLDSLPETVECVRREKTPHLRHGGLYSNMQTALCMAGDAPFMMFVQDDIQFVRDLENEDYEYIRKLCEMKPFSFVNTTFLRGRSVPSLQLTLSEDGTHYQSQNKAVYTTRTYADVVAVSPVRLREIGWQFEEGELANAKRADRELGPLRYMLDPVLMNAPRPIAYRGRSRNVVVKTMEWLYRYGVYAFKPLLADEVEKLRLRDRNILPVAEEFLSLKSGPLPKPWDYDIFESNKMVYPLFHLSSHPIKYAKYQIMKRIGKDPSVELFGS
jgi:glycosyltransferase involved in cell wall biosynthesis